MELGQRIKAARSTAKLSKAELARRVGVSHTAVAYWEEGETKSIKADHLFAISKATGCDPQWLQNGTGSPPVADKDINVAESSAQYRAQSPLQKELAHQSADLSEEEIAKALAFIGGMKAAR